MPRWGKLYHIFGRGSTHTWDRMGAAAGFEPTAAPREVSEDGCLEAAGACIQAQSRKRQQSQAGQRLAHMGRAGIGVAGGGAFTGLGRNDDHHTAAAFGPQDDGAADYFKVLIVIRTEDPLVGCPFSTFTLSGSPSTAHITLPGTENTLLSALRWASARVLPLEVMGV